jgi:hypothetical protein
MDTGHLETVDDKQLVAARIELRAALGSKNLDSLRRRTRGRVAGGHLHGGAEAQDAAAEGDRTGGEPGPPECKAAENVGQPVDVEQDAA